MSAELTRQLVNPGEGQPAPDQLQGFWGNVPHGAEPTLQEFEHWGNMAFEAAWEREREHGGHIDMQTAALYRVASRNLVDMAWASPGLPADPERLLKLSHSFAVQAEAPEVAPYSTPQRDIEGNLIDPRQNFKKLASQYLQWAGTTAESAKVVLESAVEAAHETTPGTPIVRGVGKVTVEAAERVEASGPDNVGEFLGALASQPKGRGAEFTRLTTQKAIERSDEFAIAA